MKFKLFLTREDSQSSEKGLMVSKPSPLRKPSDGQPFAKYLSAFGGGDAAPKGPMMMKKMKKS